MKDQYASSTQDGDRGETTNINNNTPLTSGALPISSTTISIKQFLQNHVLFKNLDSNFIAKLTTALQSRIFNQGEYVIKKGDLSRAMFFIFKGEVEVISEDGKTK
jgi:CRP-like cAMP-binding protein